MTIHAYHEMYLNKAQALLGDAFDYAIRSCKIDGDVFVKLFLVSSVSKRLENGDPAYIAGKSGEEIVSDVLFETTGKAPSSVGEERLTRSPEYWIGWAAAYYQWYSARSFSELFKAVSFEELCKLYYTLHEADISKFVDVVDSRIKEQSPQTNLRAIRSTYGCSQAELSRLSGVGLRSIQMYEQRNKNINKASADTIYRLAKALGCRMEDLIEHE